MVLGNLPSATIYLRRSCTARVRGQLPNCLDLENSIIGFNILKIYQSIESFRNFIMGENCENKKNINYYYQNLKIYNNEGL